MTVQNGDSSFVNLETNRRILVIDDNAAIHADFKKILCADGGEAELTVAEADIFGEESSSIESADYQIDSAVQGEEGLTLVRKALEEGAPYAMAFVDVRMPPGWDGIETVSRIWKEYPELEVVICTAYSDYSWDEITEKLGQTDRLLILKKPFDNVEVRQLACALTSKWSLARQAVRKLEALKQAVELRTQKLEEQNHDLEQALEDLKRVHNEG